VRSVSSSNYSGRGVKYYKAESARFVLHTQRSMFYEAASSSRHPGHGVKGKVKEQRVRILCPTKGQVQQFR